MRAHGKATACDERLLRAYLAQELTAAEEVGLAAHLDDCPACRRRIDDSVGEQWWTDASRFLKRDDLDEAANNSRAAAADLAASNEEGSHDPVVIRQIIEWLDPADDPRFIGRFGGYEILGAIGHGGMGVVLKGFEPPLHRYVAIKVLAPSLASSGAARQRFAREAQAAAAVLHQNVIAIHRVDEFHGLPYLVMPYVNGLSLQKRIDDEGPLPLDAVLRIARQIAVGLAAAHAQGLVHRDIKPANILLERGVERVTITDFGLARAADDGSVTKTGFIAGTPQYMSPEQARGDSLDARSDLFSLGSVLYAMCVGRPPFRAETAYGILRRITDEEPRPIRESNPNIPDWLCRIIARLMAKQPDDRFETAGEVAELLEECLAHVQQPDVVPLPRSAPPPAAPRTKGRSPILKHLARAAFALAAVFAGIAIALELNGGMLTNKSGSTGDAASAPQPAESHPKPKPMRVRHFQTGEKVWTIACSADGKLIAVANGNPTLVMQTNGTSRVKGNWKPSAEILDAETGNTVVSLKFTTDDEEAVLTATEWVSYFEVTALAFSPDGTELAVGTSIGQVKLFDSRSGELVRSLDDKRARLADREAPDNWKSLKRAMGSVASLAFSPDGSLLAACGATFAKFSDVFDGVRRLGRTATGPGRLKVWEVETGIRKHDLVGHSHAYAVSFSPDGKMLASAGRWLTGGESGTGIIIWNPHTGSKIRMLTTRANGGTHSVAFSPNSKLVVIGARVFDKDNDTSATPISLAHAFSGVVDWRHTVPGWAKPAAFSPDGKWIAVLCGGKSIRFFDTETGALNHEIRAADSPPVERWNDFAIAPEGHILAIGGVDSERRGSVEVLRIR